MSKDILNNIPNPSPETMVNEVHSVQTGVDLANTLVERVLFGVHLSYLLGKGYKLDDYEDKDPAQRRSFLTSFRASRKGYEELLAGVHTDKRNFGAIPMESLVNLFVGYSVKDLTFAHKILGFQAPSDTQVSYHSHDQILSFLFAACGLAGSLDDPRIVNKLIPELREEVEKKYLKYLEDRNAKRSFVARLIKHLKPDWEDQKNKKD